MLGRFSSSTSKKSTGGDFSRSLKEAMVLLAWPHTAILLWIQALSTLLAAIATMMDLDKTGLSSGILDGQLGRVQGFLGKQAESHKLQETLRSTMQAKSWRARLRSRRSRGIYSVTSMICRRRHSNSFMGSNSNSSKCDGLPYLQLASKLSCGSTSRMQWPSSSGSLSHREPEQELSIGVPQAARSPPPVPRSTTGSTALQRAVRLLNINTSSLPTSCNGSR